MEKKRFYELFWLRGGLVGLFTPFILFGLFLILNSFNIEFGSNPITSLLIFAMAFMQLPAVVIGRALGLPIETGGAAFILYNFTIFGYILTIFFWVLIGVLFGWIIDRRKNALIKNNSAPK